MLDELRSFLARTTTRSVLGDLLYSNVAARLGRFDVITEHFLTSLLDKNLDDIERVRARYAAALDPGGVLLSAAGFDQDSPEYVHFVELHERLGFRYVAGRSIGVWDPYGLDRASLVQFDDHRPRDVQLTLDNTLSVFVQDG